MAYNKTTWVNGSVPVDEDHLNNIENGIEGATQDAENAQSSADKAQESADNAQSTAEEAQSAADKAQETAESANTAAGDAQSAAEAAQETADSAQAAAEKAQETADSANTAVSSEVTARQSADSDLEEKIQENTDLIDRIAGNYIPFIMWSDLNDLGYESVTDYIVSDDMPTYSAQFVTSAGQAVPYTYTFYICMKTSNSNAGVIGLRNNGTMIYNRCNSGVWDGWRALSGTTL